MKQSHRLAPLCALLLAGSTILQSCSFFSSPEPIYDSLSSPGMPRPVTDLSQLAPGSALSPFDKHEQAIARRVAADDDTGKGNGANLGALTILHVGDDKHPGEERMLNKKAAEFDTLSMRLMDQIFTQIVVLQERDDISHLKLPTDLKWVIITGTISRQGVLKELVIEQHSGTAAIDKMVIAACKKGLFIHNPPPEALNDSGNYKVRFEARFENYATLDGEHWEFKTYMGLAIL